MYPTEDDFANVFESYVHKDDDISMSKVVLTDGDGNTTTLNNVIGNKADKTDLTEITNRLTTAENDIDTAEDNIAGHETRIQGLEAFKERVRAFLEDADASEETINRWHEIESFLQGITDTQTLTGLLNDLKQEILQSIPQSQQGNYLQLIDDLDAYTDAPVGTIVKYTGPTTDSYTHGFDYERKAGDGQPVEFMVPAGTPTINRIFVPESAPDNYKQFISNAKFPFKREGSYSEFTTFRSSNGSVEVLFLFSNHPSVGDLVFLREDFAPHFITEADDASFKTDIDDYSWSLSSIEPEPATAYVNVDGLRIVLDDDFERFNTPSTETDINSPVIIPDQRLYFWGDRENHVFMEKKSADQTYSYPGGSPSSWQLLPSMPVIQ